jgi:precorrin-6B methylase 2
MNLYPAASYLRHLFTARSTAGYGVHSPFMFEFLGRVIRGKTDLNIFRSVEALRREMLDDKRVISITDMGTGPSGKKRPARMISEIAATAALPAREAGLLARTVREIRIKNYELRNGEQEGGHGAGSMGHGAREGRALRNDPVGHFSEGACLQGRQGASGLGHDGSATTGPVKRESREHGARGMEPGEKRRMRGVSDESRKAGEHGEWSKELIARDQEIGNGDSGIILELGTSLGISTLALALAAEKIKVVSVEGCPALAAVARENLDRHGAGNVQVLNMEFDDALIKLREEKIKVTFAFIDGNHRGEALKHYIRTIKEMGEEMIIVADDIHLNRDMYRAWRCLTQSGTAPATLETFHFGMIFFLNKMTPGRYRIRY